MSRKITVFRGIRFVVLSSIGGATLASTGLSVGWMLGSLLMAAFLSFRYPTILRLPNGQKGKQHIWLRIGQCMLGVELGQQLTLSVLNIFKENTITITVILFLSILISLGSGYLLYKLCKTDMLTSFFSTAPGGLSAMPGIAQEVGANTAVVTMIQTIRVLVVVLSVPLIVSGITDPLDRSTMANASSIATIADFHILHIFWTIALVFAAWGGYYVGKFFKLPAPWLVGSLLTVALVQNLCSIYVGHDLIAWWPDSIMIIAQIIIGASLGSNFDKAMFSGMKRIFLVSFFSTVAFMLIMFGCAFLVTKITGIPFVTTSLAFAPGGVAEMTSTAVILNADSMFVVAVQVLRIVVVNVTLPPLFRLLNHRLMQKEGKFQT